MARQVIYDRGGAISTINALLKDDTLTDKIQDLVNRKTYMLSQIRQEEPTHGRQFIFPVETNTSQGVGARGENVVLPDPGFAEFEQALGNVKYLYSLMYITGPAISATQGNKAAYADALKTALRTTRQGLELDLARQVWGDGSGVLGVVQTTSAGSATIAVTRPYGLTYIDASLSNSDKTKTFRRKMNVFIATDNVYAQITQVNSNGTITLNSVVSVTAGSLIYRGDAVGRTSVNNEITGLSGILQATGTYLGLSRTGRPEWQANLVQVGSGAGGPVSLSGMRIAMDQADMNGTAEPTLIVTSHAVRRSYEALLTSQVRFTNPMKLEGGFSAIEYDGKPLMVDKDAPPQRIFYLHMPSITWMMMEDIQFMQRDGTVLKAVDDTDAYKAILFTYRELVTRQPADQTVQFDVTS